MEISDAFLLCLMSWGLWTSLTLTSHDHSLKLLNQETKASLDFQGTTFSSFPFILLVCCFLLTPSTSECPSAPGLMLCLPFLLLQGLQTPRLPRTPDVWASLASRYMVGRWSLHFLTALRLKWDCAATSGQWLWAVVTHVSSKPERTFHHWCKPSQSSLSSICFVSLSSGMKKHGGELTDDL